MSRNCLDPGGICILAFGPGEGSPPGSDGAAGLNGTIKFIHLTGQ